MDKDDAAIFSPSCCFWIVGEKTYSATWSVSCSGLYKTVSPISWTGGPIMVMSKVDKFQHMGMPGSNFLQKLVNSRSLRRVKLIADAA